jgi:hypothetical protein
MSVTCPSRDPQSWKMGSYYDGVDPRDALWARDSELMWGWARFWSGLGPGQGVKM